MAFEGVPQQRCNLVANGIVLHGGVLLLNQEVDGEIATALFHHGVVQFVNIVGNVVGALHIVLGVLADDFDGFEMGVKEVVHRCVLSYRYTVYMILEV